MAHDMRTGTPAVGDWVVDYDTGALARVTGHLAGEVVTEPNDADAYDLYGQWDRDDGEHWPDYIDGKAVWQ